MRPRVILRLLGFLTISISLNMVFSIFWALFYSEGVWREFVISIGISLALGAVLILVGISQKKMNLTRKEALSIVGFGWILAGIVGALPFFLSGAIPNFYDAFFETISGFTTTGASILGDIESLPKGLLFWRSYTHWLGGMGIIVLFVAIFPYLGVSGKRMYQFEVPGPDAGGITPKIQSSAFMLWKIYFWISIAEMVALKIAGMTLFDAMCHTFGTMATGGFSTKNASIGHYNNSTIYIIIIVFMILAGTNFSLYFLLLKKKFYQFFSDSEWRVYLTVILISIVFVAFILNKTQTGGTFPTSGGVGDEGKTYDTWVASAFNVVSIMTTTGFGTHDTDMWPIATKVLLLVLMFVGGCGGSTGGGIKVVRYLILIKYAIKHSITSYSPQRKVIIKLSGKMVGDDMIHRVLSFFFIYIMIFVIGILFMSSFGYDLTVTISSVAATLNNIGPGFSLIGATGNYGFMHPVAKVFLSILMVVGRLELFAIVVFFIPDFWRK